MDNGEPVAGVGKGSKSLEKQDEHACCLAFCAL